MDILIVAALSLIAGAAGFRMGEIAGIKQCQECLREEYAAWLRRQAERGDCRPVVDIPEFIKRRNNAGD